MSFAVASLAATIVIVFQQLQVEGRLAGYSVIATHWTSTDCADSFGDNVDGGVSWAGAGIAVGVFLLLTLTSVLIVVVPKKYPSCVQCINIGTPAMKARLLEQVALGQFDVVNHVMLVLCAYLMFTTAITMTSLVPVLGSSSQWNEACLANIKCQTAVNRSFAGDTSAVCCSSFDLEASCGSAALFWGAIVTLCVGSLLPLPVLLWKISKILNVVEDNETRDLLVSPAKH